MKFIRLSNVRHVMYVDDEDYERLLKFKWFMNSKGDTISRPVRWGDYTFQRSVANEIFKTYHVMYDHKDRNVCNNTRENLRACSRSQNQFNRGKKAASSSKYKGVRFHKYSGRWEARIQAYGQRVQIGQFTDEVNAAAAYDKAAKELHGEFANLNFPQSTL